MGTFQTVELIETFINYHENIKKCVCIIYDPHASTRGSLVLKAIRLKDSFIELHKAQKLTFKDLREANIAWKDVFVELPIRVHNSSLVQAVVADIMPANTCTQVRRRACRHAWGAGMQAWGKGGGALRHTWHAWLWGCFVAHHACMRASTPGHTGTADAHAHVDTPQRPMPACVRKGGGGGVRTAGAAACAYGRA